MIENAPDRALRLRGLEKRAVGPARKVADPWAHARRGARTLPAHAVP